MGVSTTRFYHHRQRAADSQEKSMVTLFFATLILIYDGLA
ncbi:hypothetical protein [Xenorhabdus bovienii]